MKTIQSVPKWIALAYLLWPGYCMAQSLPSPSAGASKAGSSMAAYANSVGPGHQRATGETHTVAHKSQTRTSHSQAVRNKPKSAADDSGVHGPFTSNSSRGVGTQESAQDTGMGPTRANLATSVTRPSVSPSNVVRHHGANAAIVGGTSNERPMMVGILSGTQMTRKR